MQNYRRHQGGKYVPETVGSLYDRVFESLFPGNSREGRADALSRVTYVFDTEITQLVRICPRRKGNAYIAEMEGVRDAVWTVKGEIGVGVGGGRGTASRKTAKK